MTKRILVVENREIFREPLAALLQVNGFESVVARNGPEAMARIREMPIDLILMDVELPIAQGLDLLKRLHQSHTHAALPVIVLTSIPDRTCIVQAAGLGVRDYILKSGFTVSRLLGRVRQLLEDSGQAAPAPSSAPANLPATPLRAEERPALVAERLAGASLIRPTSPASDAPQSSQWPKLLTREQTLERLDRIADGKTIAGVVAQVIAIASSPNADLADIVKIIESDPILATRVLQLASSAAFVSKRGRVNSVEDAARNIGVRGIQNMAIAVGIFGTFPPDELDGFNTMRCWQHSFAVAELMALFVRERDPVQEGTNHLVGLCHDLGEILLRQHFTPLYDEIVEYAMTHRLPVHAVEATALGIRHPELLSRLLSRIGLPLVVVQAIREFHERQVREQAAGMSMLARGLGIANQVAHGLLLAASPHETIAPISRTEWRLLGEDKSAPTFDPVVKRGQIIAATNILARLPAKDEQRLSGLIVPRTNRRIWYWRPENFIELDPLACALSLITELTISPKPPDSHEWDEIDGIVVVGIREGTPPVASATLADLCRNAGRPNLPVLALIARGQQPPDAGALSFRSYPIALQDLHAWVAAIPQQNPATVPDVLSNAAM